MRSSYFTPVTMLVFTVIVGCWLTPGISYSACSRECCDGVICTPVERVQQLPPARNTPADLELVLAVDASSSVDEAEFQLQIRGLSEAFQHPAVQTAIRALGNQGVAVCLIQWSDIGIQTIGVDWTLIRDAASAAALAAEIAAVRREILGGGTAIYGVINFALHEFDRNGFDGRRQVIDISGDGRSDLAVPTESARDRAVAQGVTINGLAILNDDPFLDRYYRRRVVGGDGAFVMPAADYGAFAAAMLVKLVREISKGPVAVAPTSPRAAHMNNPAIPLYSSLDSASEFQIYH